MKIFVPLTVLRFSCEALLKAVHYPRFTLSTIHLTVFEERRRQVRFVYSANDTNGESKLV